MNLAAKLPRLVRGRTLPLAGAGLALVAVGAAPPVPVPAPLTMVVTQIPIGTEAEKAGPRASGMLPADYGDGARLVLVKAGRLAKVLTAGFASAADPEVSFDGRRILFAGKKHPSDHWAIYEMNADGSGVRTLFAADDDLREPVYLPTVYTIVADPNKGTEPREHVGFVRTLHGERSEYGDAALTALYSVKLDGTQPRRLTESLSPLADPVVLRDGRVVYSSWQRATLERGERGRIALVGVNPDGLDAAVFSADEGLRIKGMACATPSEDRLVVFVESEKVGWDGAGTLASVSLKRNLHSYRRLTDERAGLFHSPSAMTDGTILAARRPADGSATHGIVRIDPSTGRVTPVFDDPTFHDVQPRQIAPRPLPDRRSSAIKDPDEGATAEAAQTALLDGKLYGLNVYLNDLGTDLPPGTIAKLRVIEGLPARDDAAGRVPARRRVVGEAPVERDGSYQVIVPAEVPLQLQILDADGLALRTSGWIWVPYKGQQGCVGCHEDGELTPRNRFVDAIARPATNLLAPEDKRVSIDFRRDIRPIVAARCASCHGEGKSPRLDSAGSAQASPAYDALLAGLGPQADGSVAGRFVHPGNARTSPVMWHLFGRNTSRPAGAAEQKTARPAERQGPTLSDDERRLFAEWIDLGAPYDSAPRPSPDSATATSQTGAAK